MYFRKDDLNFIYSARKAAKENQRKVSDVIVEEYVENIESMPPLVASTSIKKSTSSGNTKLKSPPSNKKDENDRHLLTPPPVLSGWAKMAATPRKVKSSSTTATSPFTSASLVPSFKNMKFHQRPAIIQRLSITNFKIFEQVIKYFFKKKKKKKESKWENDMIIKSKKKSSRKVFHAKLITEVSKWIAKNHKDIWQHANDMISSENEKSMVSSEKTKKLEEWYSSIGFTIHSVGAATWVCVGRKVCSEYLSYMDKFGWPSSYSTTTTKKKCIASPSSPSILVLNSPTVSSKKLETTELETTDLETTELERKEEPSFVLTISPPVSRPLSQALSKIATSSPLSLSQSLVAAPSPSPSPSSSSSLDINQKIVGSKTTIVKQQNISFQSSHSSSTLVKENMMVDSPSVMLLKGTTGTLDELKNGTTTTQQHQHQHQEHNYNNRLLQNQINHASSPSNFSQMSFNSTTSAAELAVGQAFGQQIPPSFGTPPPLASTTPRTALSSFQNKNISSSILPIKKTDDGCNRISQTATVIKYYSAIYDSHVSLYLGNIIEIDLTSQSLDGWCYGKNQTTLQSGWFPLSCVFFNKKPTLLSKQLSLRTAPPVLQTASPLLKIAPPPLQHVSMLPPPPQQQQQQQQQQQYQTKFQHQHHQATPLFQSQPQSLNLIDSCQQQWIHERWIQQEIEKRANKLSQQKIQRQQQQQIYQQQQQILRLQQQIDGK
jgi:hypothetical protein